MFATTVQLRQGDIVSKLVQKFSSVGGISEKKPAWRRPAKLGFQI
jgi:hypothetical protein